MGTKLGNLEALSPEDIEALAGLGLATTDEVLQRTAQKEARTRLAAESGVDRDRLDRLASIADLMRIPGLAEPHAVLLAALDTPTAAALATREAPALMKQMRRKNVELLIVRGMPPESTVARWIDDASRLPPGAEL